MPYEIKHDIEGCSGYAVVVQGGSKIMGCHGTKAEAMKQLAALHMNDPDAKKIWDGTFSPKLEK